MPPIYHERDDPVRRRMFVPGLALFLKRDLEHQLADELPELSSIEAPAALRSIGLSELSAGHACGGEGCCAGAWQPWDLALQCSGIMTSGPIALRGPPRIERYTMKATSVCLLAGTLLLSAGTPGCRSRKGPKPPTTIEGTVAEIDRSGRRVSFRFYHPKLGQEVTEEAAIGDDAEIMIDGKLSTLRDVKEGDTAQVTLIPPDKSRPAHVLKVIIKRMGAERQPPTGPASGPASRPK